MAMLFVSIPGGALVSKPCSLFHSPCTRRSPLYWMVASGEPCPTRRALLQAAAALLCASILFPGRASALRPGKPSKERLLERINPAKTPEELEAEHERLKEERRKRLERQKELMATRGEGEQKGADLEANLRANYYYPTARMRYLPRVRRATEEFGRVREDVGKGAWRVVEAKAKGVFEDAVLPMKLYASSLSGQGLSLSVAFVSKMVAQADSYEKALGSLKTAAKKKNSSDAYLALDSMEASVADYRTAGKLEAPDFGIGQVPTESRVGSSLGNNNPFLYNRNITEIEKTEEQ